MSLVNIALKLNGYHVEENYEEGDYKFRLVTEVVGLETKHGVVTGAYTNDSILHVFHRGTSAPCHRQLRRRSVSLMFKIQLFSRSWKRNE